MNDVNVYVQRGIHLTRCASSSTVAVGGLHDGRRVDVELNYFVRILNMQLNSFISIINEL